MNIDYLRPLDQRDEHQDTHGFCQCCGAVFPCAHARRLQLDRRPLPQR